MQRRALLAVLGTTLTAGCGAFGRAPAEPSPSPAPVPSDTPTPDGPTSPDTDGQLLEPERHWSLVEFETLPVTVSLTGTRGRTRDGGTVVMQFVRTATADHPAVIRGAFRNANPFENTFDLQGLPLFRNVPSAWPGGRPRDDQYTYRDELVLAPTDGHELALTVPELTLADDGRWRLTGAIDGPWLPETRRLAADESVTVEYALVGRPEGQGFPCDRYHFEGYGDREVVFSVWDTDRPGPTTGSQFDGSVVAPLPAAAEMAWYHNADATTSTFLRPGVEQAELPATVEFTLVNHGHEPVSGNPYFWRLWKRVDGRWFHVAPWGWPQPLTRVPPGGTMDWALGLFDGHTADCEGAYSVGHLGGGPYAFEVGIGHEDVTHAALIDVEASAVDIEPTDGLDVTRDGATVDVAWPRRDDKVPRATLTLTRTAEADARLIPEQVMQQRNAALRNTLAFVTPEVDRVVLVTDRNTVSRGTHTRGYEDGSFRFEFDGVSYEAAATFDDGG